MGRVAGSILACILCLSLATAFPSRAGADETVIACGPYANNVFGFSSSYGMTGADTCPGGSLALYASGYSFKAGQGVIWQASAPPGLVIVGASVPQGAVNSAYVNMPSNGQYGGNFYWNGGISNITPYTYGANLGPFNSSYIGFLLVCDTSTCNGLPAPYIKVSEFDLHVHETSGPWLTSPTGLWPSKGWVRGKWPLSVSGDSPSGLCEIAAVFGGTALPDSKSGVDPSRWHQCAAPTLSDEINTADYPTGANTLIVGAWDAAGGFVDYTRAVDVDNETPTVGLSGPSDAPSTAGVQYITATATAGPSGVAGISCAVDGGALQWHPVASLQIPVSGVGQHTVRCLAKNKALDASGTPGTSAPASFAIKIGQPTVSAVAFSKLVNGLRCRRVDVRVRRHSRTRRVKVTRCRVRIRRRRVTIWVTVKRHGHKVRVRERRVIRVVLTPRTVARTQEVVPHGHGTTVQGWLGTDTGTALANQTVQVLTAPDNGQNDYSLAAVVTTAADGTWSARLPAGPSRLVTASYGGGPATQPSLAAPARLVVPARVRLLSVHPRQVAWGGTIKLVGDLAGGYLPPGGALVRLRIGLGRAFTTYGVHEHVGGSGRFTTAYTFGVGDAAIKRSYWFQIASLPMGNYPFAPASSRRMTVLVGGHPRVRSGRHR